jgi:hypothetical protein
LIIIFISPFYLIFIVALTPIIKITIKITSYTTLLIYITNYRVMGKYNYYKFLIPGIRTNLPSSAPQSTLVPLAISRPSSRWIGVGPTKQRIPRILTTLKYNAVKI